MGLRTIRGRNKPRKAGTRTWHNSAKQAITFQVHVTDGEYDEVTLEPGETYELHEAYEGGNVCNWLKEGKPKSAEVPVTQEPVMVEMPLKRGPGRPRKEQPK